MIFNKAIKKKNGNYRPQFFTEFAVVLPVKNISLLSKKTKRLLYERDVIILEDLIKIEVAKYPSWTNLDSLIFKIKEKAYLLENELRVLKYINDDNIRINTYVARTILSISAFSFLFNDRDLKEVIKLLLPEHYSEKPLDKRRNSKNRKITKIVYLDTKKIHKKIS